MIKKNKKQKKQKHVELTILTCVLLVNVIVINVKYDSSLQNIPVGVSSIQHTLAHSKVKS